MKKLIYIVMLSSIVFSQNEPPVLIPIGDQFIDEDTQIYITLSATDPDGDVLTFTAATDNENIVASLSSNILTLMPSENYYGMALVTVTVSDGILADSETFTVTVIPVNDAPVLLPIGDQDIDEDTQIDITLVAYDVDGDELVFTAASDTEDITVSLNGTVLTLIPAENFIGSAMITVMATDGNVGSNMETFTLTVLPVNDLYTWHISTTGSDETGDGSEENPFATIQQGIEVANDGDTVLVYPGTFYGAINFLSKNLVLGSLYLLEENESYIDETILSNFVNISSAPDSELNGFTFQDFYLNSDDGLQAIIYIENASPIIINNRFDNFYLFQGVESAVIYCDNSSSMIMNNVFTNGSVGNGYILGGFILSKNSNLTIKNNRIENGYVGFAEPSGYIVSLNSENIIESNIIINSSMGYCWVCATISILDGSNCIIRNNLILQASGDGYGAVVASQSQYVSRNNTFVSNSVGYANLSSAGIVSNDIIYGTSNPVYLDDNSSMEVSYSDIEGGWEGEGNIDADPIFVNPESGDYHLHSNSPCIDSGDPESPLDPDGTIADMGAFYYHQASCDSGFVEIEGMCFNSDDIAVLQKFIDNSYESGIDLDCEEWDEYCGSPNPYMDSTDGWFWNIVDGQEYYFSDGDGIVEPLEIGLQEWENGRLTSIMCGAYIYCQLSGPIPENINELSEIEQLRLEYNYLSDYIPEEICDLDVTYSDDLSFDITGNYLCPPYPECIEDYVGYQDTTNCGLGSITINNLSDWNLVGLPLEVEDASYNILFPESVEGTLYSFDGGYISETYLNQGEGYWLRFDSAGSYTITGVPIYELTISLNEGWNLISGLTGDVSIYSIFDPDTIVVPGTLYGFNGGYVETDMLVPGNGYWLRAYQAGNITLTSGEISKINPYNFSLKGKANTLSVNGTELYFGVELSAKERLSYSLPPKPPSGAFDVRFKGDTRVTKERAEIELMSTTETLTIAYNVVLDSGEHMNWVLTSENGKEFILEGTREITVPSSEKFILNRKNVIPVTFTLHQNFPNPFNPITTLRYDLPSDALVTLSIYDMLGREITQLVNTSQEAGFKSVQWDATDSMGRPVSAGVYLYQIQAGEFIQTKKMVLLK